MSARNGSILLRCCHATYAHPLIKSLGQDDRRPSYIPSRTFAIALLDIVATKKDGKSELPLPDASPFKHVVRSLELLREEAGDDVDQFKKQIEVWFNNSMERVAGWYKRRTQVLLLIWAVVVTIGANADSLVIVNSLWRDPALRDSLVAQAQRYVAEQPRPSEQSQDVEATAEPPDVPPDQQSEIDFQRAQAQFDATVAQLEALRLPIGWKERATQPQTEGQQAQAQARISEPLRTSGALDVWPGAIWPFDGYDEFNRWLAVLDRHKFGWLLTILAVSLGAPFWFDTLNKIISIRAVGKAPEEKQKSPKQIPKPKGPGDKT